jgi:hypothetical protein
MNTWTSRYPMPFILPPPHQGDGDNTLVDDLTRTQSHPSTPTIAAVGRELDDTLAGLLAFLGAPVPALTSPKAPA